MALTTLLTVSDFTNPFTIFEKNKDNDGYEVYFDDILARAQKEFLLKLLGYQMYNYMLTNYTEDNGDFYDLLVKGTTYTYNGISYVFEGIKPALMRYSYFEWQNWNKDRLASSGSLKQNFKESQKVIPVQKMYTAYREMLEMVESAVAYAPTIWHYIETQYTGTNWEYQGFEKKNAWGI